ncbi:MAG: hypothetical protein RMJ98_07795 [Myxococcales bacterium]|nr:hypothetical protein [Polyangiaceae bacterium]MDW8249188.1 hypothetical protein [Myxococcales bacterium]
MNKFCARGTDGRELAFRGATVPVRAQGGLAVVVLTQRSSTFTTEGESSCRSVQAYHVESVFQEALRRR